MNSKFLQPTIKPRSYYLYKEFEQGFKKGKLAPEVFADFKLAYDLSVQLSDEESLTFMLLFSQLKLQQEQGHSSLSFTSWLEFEQQWNKLNRLAKLYYKFLEFWQQQSKNLVEQQLDLLKSDYTQANVFTRLQDKSHRLEKIKENQLEKFLLWQFYINKQSFHKLLESCFGSLTQLEQLPDVERLMRDISTLTQSLQESRVEVAPESIAKLAALQRGLDYTLTLVLAQSINYDVVNFSALLVREYLQDTPLSEISEVQELVKLIIEKFNLDKNLTLEQLLPFGLLLLDLWQKLRQEVKLLDANSSGEEHEIALTFSAEKAEQNSKLSEAFAQFNAAKATVTDTLDSLKVNAEPQGFKILASYLKQQQLEQSYQLLVNFYLPQLENFFSQPSLLTYAQTAFFALGKQDLQISSAPLAEPRFQAYLQQETLAQLIARLQEKNLQVVKATGKQKAPPLLYLTFNPEGEQEQAKYSSAAEAEQLTNELATLQAKFPLGKLSQASFSLNAAYRKETRLWFNFLQRVKHEISRLEAEPSSKAQQITETLQFWYKFIQDYQGYSEVTEQQVAIVNSIGRNLSLIIGGPGTGKTTTVFSILLINTILKLTANPHQLVHISLVAPTGKASEHLHASIVSKAKELKQKLLCSQGKGEHTPSVEPVFQTLTTEQQQLLELALNQILHAKGETIHTSFGVNASRPREYAYLGNNKHPADIIIIDEVGMINLSIFDIILRSLSRDSQLICLGDKDQLPAIGIGYFLGNLSAQDLAYSQVGQQLLSQYGLGNYGQSKDEENPATSKVLYRYNPQQESLGLGDFVHQLVRSYRYAKRESIGKYAELVNNPHADLSKASLEIFANQEHDVQIKLTCYQAYYYAAQLAKLTERKVYNRKAYQKLSKTLQAVKLDPELALSYSLPLAVANSNPLLLSENTYKPKSKTQPKLTKGLEKFISESKSADQDLDQNESETNLSWSEQLTLVASHNLAKQEEISYSGLVALPSLLNEKLDSLKDAKFPSLANYSQQLVLDAAQKAFAHLKALIEELTSATLLDHEKLQQVFSELKNTKFLCPMRQGKLGVEELNQQLKNFFTKPQGKLKDNYGYPILVTQNQSDLNLVNGDIGIILKNAQSSEQRCYFNKKSANSDFLEVAPSQINAFEEAFFTTIHKSQGDEFANTHVVLPLEINKFISRAMYYTGITRVKQNLYIYAPVQFFLKASLPEDKRHTSLEFDWKAVLSQLKAN